jgi:hypothetical protein
MQAMRKMLTGAALALAAPSARAILPALALMFALGSPAHAVHISFTGGTFTSNEGWAGITANEFTISNLDNYREDAFVFNTPVGNGHAGDYYAVQNDVLHSDWSADVDGEIPAIYGYKQFAEVFDLNGFRLTSNSARKYGNATGAERVFLHASLDGATSSYGMLMPVEDWGFPGSLIVLGAEFKGIKAFWFTADAGVGFGIDDVYIDEAVPGTVPEPGTLALVGLALAALRTRYKNRTVERPKGRLPHTA